MGAVAAGLSDSPSCDNIQPTVQKDLMARGRSLGFGSNCSTIRYPLQVQRSERFSSRPVQSFVRIAKGLLLLLAFCCPASWLVVPGYAQDEDQNVHLVPHEAKKPDPVPSAGIAVPPGVIVDRQSTRLNSSHLGI